MWKKIDRNPNYSINEKGEVRNDRTGYIKKPFINKGNGYLIVDLYQNNRAEKVPIHRLVAEAFIQNPENKATVDHIDGNRRNNSISNLRWATYSENNSRFESVGVRSEAVVVTRYAEKRKKRGGGHLAWLDAIEVVEFSSISETADYFGCTISNISLMLEKGTIGQRGRTRGYQFSYKDGKRSTFNS
ncbi:HNH endonuclease [Streptococcus dysgalactiae subsp. equisimilis]|uniref:HNH endonuclease n=1 Tax=Streptococcus dysgalactiae subsp. equisimilis TaxID=119602 RepID=A0AB38XZS6_STREQ|nr:HNH endonuclease [Streptococcus dysgalactiae]TYK93774.1 endodeoxyribonuclease [Streptococcus dysgalactiae]WEQ88413.1 HNH endonuclease [Streptococcus dysgalactiae subsp. equisimilis]WHM78509.1 HNH endonuclease [Streptococcus dysgalactiae subsp. equisimilis]SQG93494.1 endodeoxyribonuclease [Streptococcus dysgalactiae subsp. equisimilis]BAH81617.1 putative endodeoxyribonuclease [Streptococcus dysgalactiae subsp. equisimilis GGS_124]